MEKSLLISYGEGKVVPNNNDLFPEVYIFPDFECADGEVWKNSEDLTINEASRKKKLW